MAAPPPPPPPPPAPTQIAKPNNNKLLESIRQGTGLKKVPESEKSDRSVVTASVKPGGKTTAMELPADIRGASGAPLSIADALKARQQNISKGAQGITPAPIIPPSKRVGAPPPNQNVSTANNIPKPPAQNSKPSVNNADTKPLLPPPLSLQNNALNKPSPPKPIPASNPDRPLASPHHILSSLPPPNLIGNQQKVLPPPMQPGVINKPIAPPPMQTSGVNRPFAPPPPSGNSEKPPHPVQMNFPPPPPPSMESKTNEGAPSYPSVNRTHTPVMNGSMRNTPPMCAPPPPPPISSMPSRPQPPISVAKPAPYFPPPNNIDVPVNKPTLPVRVETTNTFESRFTFPDESLFPDPSTILKRKT